MRAYELALFIVLLSGAIGLVNGLGVFSESYISTPQNYVSGSFNVSELNKTSSMTGHSGALDYFSSIISWSWQGLTIFLNVIFCIVCLYPTLVNDFGVPALLSGFMQLGIYVVYAVGFIQFLTGKQMKGME